MMPTLLRGRAPAPRHLLAPLAAFVLAACAHAGSAVSPTAAAPATAPTPGPVPTLAERVRSDSARYPYTAADVRFMTMMIGHHSQAIVMANMAPSHGASASVRTLAERIINAQQDEIATMQGWLRDRGKPVPVAGAPMAPMAGMSGMSHDSTAMAGMSGMAGMSHDSTGGSMAGMAMPGMLMPGMLTAAQLARLDAARGPEFDRLFLTFMIQHHRGATSMVRDLFGTYGAAQDEQVFKFASDVNVDQTTEIARMQRMLFTADTEGSSK